jgi:hypothetical protein
MVDAVFTDINMPVMSHELLTEIARRESWKDILRIVISTDGSQLRQEEVRELNVSLYIRKPFRPEVVRNVLSRIASAHCADAVDALFVAIVEVCETSFFAFAESCEPVRFAELRRTPGAAGRAPVEMPYSPALKRRDGMSGRAASDSGRVDRSKVSDW